MTFVTSKFHTDFAPYYKKLGDNMTKMWKDATREFLKHVIKNNVIHVDTGMSKAALLPLARQVRMLTVVRATIRPQRGPRKGYTDLQGNYHPDQYKSMEHGQQLGEKAFILHMGSKDNPIWTFKFMIQVFQHFYHEPTWQSLLMGQHHFQIYIQKNWKKYVPNLFDWFIHGKLSG